MEPKTIIEKLRRTGYRVLVNHYRYVNGKLVPNNEVRGDVCQPECKGGLTEVVIKDKITNNEFKGMAFCSKKDNFSKKMGLSIALGRVIKNNLIMY